MKNYIYTYSFTFCLIWAAVIFALCATPGQYIPSANWLELLSFDKFVHASIFFILTTLGLLSLVKNQRSQTRIVFFFLVCVSYGALLELMQAYCFSNRSADWKDMVANSFGCVMALLLLKKIKIFSNLQKNMHSKA
jgi:hypothetical protein